MTRDETGAAELAVSMSTDPELEATLELEAHPEDAELGLALRTAREAGEVVAAESTLGGRYLLRLGRWSPRSERAADEEEAAHVILSYLARGDA